jgi:pimeloyl-ACP methyl ester carboxylesterase
VLGLGNIGGAVARIERAFDMNVTAWSENLTAERAAEVGAARVSKEELFQDDPAILVGHSYGGVVITEAGNHAKVAGLVYVAAFAPDEGESVASLIANPPPGAPVPPQDGFLLLDRAKFADSFAADLDPKLAAFRADSQVPWGFAALEGVVRQPAWRSKPSWYVVATDDRMIPPPAEHAISKRAGASVSEVKASHAIYEWQPTAVATAIERASVGVR